MHLVTRVHFRSRDKDGGLTNRSAIAEDPMLQTNFMAACLTEPEIYYYRRSKFHFVGWGLSTARLHCSQCGRAILAIVCLSVCPYVTFRYCVQTNEDTIVRFSASGRTIPVVSGEVKFIRIFTPSGGVKVRHPSIDSEKSTNNRP